MRGSVSEDTGRRRKYSESDVDELVRKRERQVDQVIDTHHTWFGPDGRRGRAHEMEEDVKAHESAIKDLLLFKVRVLAYATAGGAIAGLLIEGLRYLAGKA
jgi:hypothetical protein